MGEKRAISHAEAFQIIYMNTSPIGGEAQLSTPEVFTAHTNLMPKSTARDMEKSNFSMKNLTNSTSAR